MLPPPVLNRFDRQAISVGCPPKHPLIMWLCLAVMVNTMPTALGFLPVPVSLQQLPAIIARVGAAGIAFGSLFLTVGQLWPNRKRHTGLAWERAGLRLTIIGAGLYAYALWSYTPWFARAFAFGQTLGFALGSAAYLIWIDLYLHGRKLRKNAEKADR